MEVPGPLWPVRARAHLDADRIDMDDLLLEELEAAFAQEVRFAAV